MNDIDTGFLADLAGAFAVWAASKEAAFLHGRSVWANWDVEEIIKLKPKLESDPGLFKIGLQGGETVDVAEFVRVLVETGK